MGAKSTYPPGPSGWLFKSPLWKFRSDPLNFLQRATAEHGDIVHFMLGRTHFYLLNHPDLVRDVLVTHNDSFMKGRALQRSKRILGEGLLTSEGEAHRRQRLLAQPAFQKQRLGTYAPAMVEAAARTAGRWRDGETYDISKEMMRLTLAIVGKTLFGAEVEGDSQEVGEALTLLVESFDQLFVPFSQILEKLPLPKSIRMRRAIERLDAVVYRLIEKGRASGADRGDLLSMLLRAREDGKGMSDKQLRDEALTIFLAGHETTANALTWTWYLLSQNLSTEAGLHEELGRVLGDRVPTVEDVPRLKFTEMVFAEAMRLYPPAWAIGRLSLKEYAARDYTIPKGGLVVVSPYVTQRDARFFPEPERFDPQRWTPEAREARHPFAYFPFGGGPRRCIGEGFAWMEGILLIATLAQRWRLRLDPAQVVAPQALMTLRTKFGMRMKVEQR